jgi:hypothetical protein
MAQLAHSLPGMHQTDFVCSQNGHFLALGSGPLSK